MIGVSLAVEHTSCCFIYTLAQTGSFIDKMGMNRIRRVDSGVGLSCRAS